MSSIKPCYLRMLFIVACAVLAHCALEPALATDHYADSLDAKNPNEDSTMLSMQKRPSFFVGSRYGRSGASSPLFASSKTRRLNVVPRNDRFFLGSRYGKRSGEFMTPVFPGQYSDEGRELGVELAPGVAGPLPSPDSATSGKAGGNSPFMMSCIYTGVRNLYRCNNIDELNNIINQLTTGQSEDDDK